MKNGRSDSSHFTTTEWLALCLSQATNYQLKPAEIGELYVYEMFRLKKFVEERNKSEEKFNIFADHDLKQYLNKVFEGMFGD